MAAQEEGGDKRRARRGIHDAAGTGYRKREEHDPPSAARVEAAQEDQTRVISCRKWVARWCEIVLGPGILYINLRYSMLLSFARNRLPIRYNIWLIPLDSIEENMLVRLHCVHDETARV